MSAMVRRLVPIACLCAFAAIAGAAEEPREEPAAPPEAREEPPARLPDVFVRGKPRDLFEEPAVESPGLEPATTIIDRAMILRQNAYTIIDALSYVPGSLVETRGRKVKQFFSVRGQRYPYPEYAIDGAWWREFHEMPYFLTAANVERIEVLRSSAALLTGPGAMAGLVNIVPRTYEETETGFETMYGSYNTSTVHVNHGGAGRALSYAIGVGNRASDGPKRENAAENMTDIFGRLVGKPTDELTLACDLYGLYGRQELEKAEPPATVALQQDRSRYDPYRALLAIAKATWRPSERATTAWIVNYGLRDHGFLTASDADPRGKTSNEEDYEYGTSAIQSIGLWSGNTLRLAGLFNRWVAPDGKRFYAGKRNDLWTYSAAIVDEQKIGPVELSLGYRFSRTYLIDYGAFGIEGSAAGLRGVTPVETQWEDPLHNASAGAALRISDWLSLHLNAMAGQIDARTGTLDTDFRRPERETRYKFDLGPKFAWPGVGEATVAAFYVLQDDGIALSGKTATIGGRVYELYENRDQEDIGIELDLRSAPFPCGLQGFFNALAMEGRVEKAAGGRRLVDDTPRIVLAAGLLFERWSFDAAIFAKYYSEYESARFVPAALGPRPLGDVILLNANAGYTFGKTYVCRIFVAGENLTDRQYSTVAGYPDWGVRAYAGVRFTL